MRVEFSSLCIVPQATCLFRRYMFRVMEQDTDMEQSTVGIPVPAAEPELFRHKATNDILRVLLDNPYERVTIRELARLTDNAAQSVKRAVDVLEANEIVFSQRAGNRRLVGINRTRISNPDDSVLRIPQPDYHLPVRKACNRLHEEFDDILGILVFGSVARGQADRQSDIDLWVLVCDRIGKQHRANQIAKQLGKERFGGDRYEYQILIESPQSADEHGERLRDVFSDAITLEDSEILRTLKREVLSGV